MAAFAFWDVMGGSFYIYIPYDGAGANLGISVVLAWVILAGYCRTGRGREWGVLNAAWGCGGAWVCQFVTSKGAKAIYLILTLETGLRCVILLVLPYYYCGFLGQVALVSCLLKPGLVLDAVGLRSIVP